MLTPFFRNASTKRQYDMAGALRGPDHAGEGFAHMADIVSLKRFVTARIRCIIFGSETKTTPHAAWNSTRVETSHIESAIKAVRSYREANPTQCGHYLGHLVTAVKASREHPIWSGRADEIIAAFQGARK